MHTLKKLKTETEVKHFAYLRKSSEDKERQVLSIESQKEKVLESFSGLDIEFIVEEKSAFIPYNRPKFAAMVERIRRGERRGLIAWHPDRLSRNEVDASSITYMIRKGELQDLKFPTYTFENTPEGIWMLQMALSQSQYESAKKSRDVKRGLGKKASMGIQPGFAPIPYRNEKLSERGKSRILVDEERFPIVRKAVDYMLTGKYPLLRLLDIINEEWGFRTPKGHKMRESTLYYIFTRPFMYGEFEYPRGSGMWHKGTHKPLMTRNEHEHIQILLGRPSQTRPKTHLFPYRGPMRCGECGAMITCEKKWKKLADGGLASYIYYHCTKRKNPDCAQGSIEEKLLEEQIADELAQLEIPEDFKQWAMAYLRRLNEQAAVDHEEIYGVQRRQYEGCVRRINSLIDMRANGELTEEEFKGRKELLVEEKGKLQSLLNDTDRRVDNWLEIAERGFNFAEQAQHAFDQARKTDDVQLKIEIFTALGSNYTLMDGILCISLDNLLFPIKKAAKDAREVFARLEPTENAYAETQNGDKYAKVSSLCPTPVPNLVEQGLVRVSWVISG